MDFVFIGFELVVALGVKLGVLTARMGGRKYLSDIVIVLEDVKGVTRGDLRAGISLFTVVSWGVEPDCIKGS